MTKGKIDEIVALRKNGMSWREIGEKLGMTKEAVRSLYRRHENAGTLPEPQTPAEEFAKIAHDGKSGGVEWREIVNEAIRRQDFSEAALGKSPREANVEIATDKPVTIIFTGDWHLGAGRTNYQAWLEDMQYVIDTDGVYMIDVGDDRENIRRFRTLAAVFGQVLKPAEQAVLMRGIVDELTSKNKLLAKVGGNHDIEFDERAGFATVVQMYVYEKMKAPLFQNRGVLHLKVGNAKYDILLFHKSRFRSFLTPTHGARRELMLSYPLADIVAGGHDHQPGIEVFWYNMLADAMPTTLIKVGTYSDSVYGWRYFHNGGFPINPSVVLHPKERKVIPFANPHDAVTYMRAIGENK